MLPKKLLRNGALFSTNTLHFVADGGILFSQK